MLTLWLLIDGFLIYPFRLLSNNLASFWLGCVFISLLCIVIGRLTGKLLFFLNKAYYQKQNAELEHYQTLSIKAANTGNKDTYKAVNHMANDSFGKSFFTGAALFSATLWPLPFAMFWLSTRFEGVGIFTLIGTEREMNYAFVMLACYIVLRLGISRIWK